MTAEVYYSTYPKTQWCETITWGSNAFPYCFDTSNTADQSTAEWMDERPNCQNTGLSPLADFGYTQFSNAYAHSTARGWHTLAGSNPEAITMSDYSGQMAHPDNPPPSATTFIDHWDGLGNGSACYQF